MGWRRSGAWCRRLLALAGLALGLAARPAAESTAPSALTGRPQVRVFTDREGLRQNSVEALGLDDQGYAWIGTQDGAMRYDGRLWTPVDMPAPRRSNWVTAMVLSHGGARWFATNNSGVARWDGAWTLFDTSAGLPSDTTYSLEAGCGTLWVGTAEGPARWTGSRFEALPGTQPWRHGAVRALLVRGTTADPEVWVGADGGLGCFHHGAWRWFGQAGGLPSPLVTSLLDGEGRQIWVGTQEGLAVGEPGAWRVMNQPGLLPHPSVACLQRTVSRRGQPVLWVGTDAGLLRWEGARRQVWGQPQGMTSPSVRSLLVQRGPSGRETVWVGTFGGLVRFTEGTWTSLEVQDGLPANLVLSFYEEPRSGTLWLGTFQGLASYQNGRWTTHGAAAGLPRTRIFSLAGEPGGEALWVGTRGQGVFRLEGGRARPVPGLPDTFVYALHVSREADGTPVLWAGTRAGLSRWRAGAWTHFGPGQNVPKALVSSITEVKGAGGKPQLWVGTRGAGLGVLEAGQAGFTWFGAAQGLVDQRVMHLLPVAEGGEARIWVSTQGGLQQFTTTPPAATDRVLNEASTPALPGNQVYTSQRGHDGSLYVFTHRGVLRLGRRPDGGAEVQTFTTGDGLPSNGCVQGASLVDARGRIWVGTVLGVAILDPTVHFIDDQPKPLFLGEARNGDRVLAGEGPWELPWRVRHLKVRFSLLSYHREGDSRFRSQMVGLEAEPTAWEAGAEREFVSLPPGSYTLRFWGRDHVGNESGPVQVFLDVQAPPWLRWWALIGYVLLLTGGVVGLILWRVGRLQRQNADLAVRVQAATAEVRRQNEALDRFNQHLGRLNEEKNHMLGIAAHDLRNPLSSIGLYAETLLRKGDGETTERTAQRILERAREMAMLIERLLDTARIDAGQIALRMEGLDPGILLTEVAERHRQGAQAKGLKVVVDLPEGGLPAVLADPFHLVEALDNLVGNALKFMPPGPPLRQVVLRARPGLIEVQDEGPGFTEEDRVHAFERFRRLSARPTGGEGSTGLGLSIVKALVEAMGGEIELLSEPGQGATFRIHLGRA